MGEHHRSFNDPSAPLNRWNIRAKFDSELSCKKEKEHLRTEAPIRLNFAVLKFFIRSIRIYDREPRASDYLFLPAMGQQAIVTAPRLYPKAKRELS